MRGGGAGLDKAAAGRPDGGGLAAFRCAAAFTAAADLAAGRCGGSHVAPFTAGEISVKAQDAGESTRTAAELRQAAERLMAPYTDAGDICLRGVRG